MTKGHKVFVLYNQTRLFKCPCGWQCEAENNSAYLLLKLHTKICNKIDISKIPKNGYNNNPQDTLDHVKKNRTVEPFTPPSSMHFANGEPILIKKMI